MSEDIMSQLFGNGGSSSIPSRPPIEAELSELMARAKDYLSPPVFKMGSLVTPKPGSAYRGAGTPHIVIGSRESNNEQMGPSSESGSPFYGVPLNLRVLCLSPDNSTYLTYWVESSTFEPYVGPNTNVMN